MSHSQRFAFALKSLVVTLVLLVSLGAQAQGTFVVFNLDVTNFPTIRAKFFAADPNGKPINGLGSSDFKVTENGFDRPVKISNCPDIRPLQPVTVGIMINTYSYINIAQQGTARLINFLNMPPSECGITMMNVSTPVILQDITQQRKKVLDVVPQIVGDPALEVQKMFYDPVAGGVPFVISRPNRKILVLITDMHCPHFEFDERQFYADAGRYNISAYTVILGSNDYNGLFSRLATRTGGKIWERVTTAAQIDDIFAQIGIEAQQDTPCDIEWQSAVACDSLRTAKIELVPKNLASTVSYTVPSIGVGRMEIEPSTLAFGPVLAPATKDLTVSITARNKSITIGKITSSNPRYTIISGGAPPSFTIKQDETRTITVRFTPTDSAYAFAKLDIEDDNCKSDAVYNFGGFPGKRPTIPTLKLVKPNGGEVFLVGSDTVMRWTGVAPDQKVNLSYSIDRGVTWSTVGQNLTGYSYPWHVPSTPSRTCIAKVTEPRPDDSSVIVLRRPEPYADSSVYSPPYANFSPDGNRISSTEAGWEGGVVWDILTKAVTSFPAFSNTVVTTCNFSPDGTKVVSASLKGLVRIWDASTGASILTLDAGIVGAARFAQFSNDGTFVVSAYSSGDLVVWDAKTGVQLVKLRDNTSGGLNCAYFSPDGSQIATISAGPGGNIKVWDWNNSRLLHFFPLSSGARYVNYSPDGTMLIIPDGDYGAALLDAVTGAIVRRFNCNVGPIAMANFSYDGSMIVAASLGGTAIVWNATSGQITNTLKVDGSSAITSAFFSPDGSRVVTGGDEFGGYPVRVWPLHDYPFQEDQSDSLWAIVAPTINLTTLDIDMHTVAVGKIKDSVVTATLCNTSTFWPLHVLGMDVTSGNSTDFMIVSGAGDFTLAPGECRNVVFSFAPTAVGPEDARVTVRTSLGDFRDTIHVYGVGAGSDILLEADNLDFGTVEVNATKDMTVTAVLKNTGSAPITFDRDAIIGPGAAKFTMISGSAPFTLLPGEEHGVTGRFSPSEMGRVSGKILFYYTGVGSPAVVGLIGKGTGGEVYLPNDSAAPGDQILVPLKLVGPATYLVNAGATKFRATIAFDASVLTPTNSASRGTVTADGLQTTTITGTWDGKTDVLSQIPMTVGLGRFEKSLMMVPSFTWLDNNGADLPLDYASSNGSFTLLKICTAGGARLFDVMGKAELNQSRPNPSRHETMIDFTTSEQGTTTLVITDMLGRTVQSLLSSDLTPGKHTAQFDATHLAEGVYYYILKTPSQRFIKAMQVIR